MQKKALLLFSSLALSSVLLSATLSKNTSNNSLVVYNANIALVHEERQLKLNAEETEIVYEDVASSINTDTMFFTLDPSIEIQTQHYNFNPLSQQKLLQEHIGKKVEVRLLRNKNEFKVILATLLSTNGSQSLIQTIDYKIMTVDSKNISFEKNETAFMLKPSIVLNVKTQKDSQTTLKLDYLVNNISFKTLYTLHLNADTNKTSLQAWMSINNRSGKEFLNTSLSLVTGEINRVHNTRQAEYAVSTMRKAAPSVVQTPQDDYHIYKIPFLVNLKNNQKTQIKFLTANDLNVSKEYTTHLSNPLYLQGEHTVDVMQSISFKTPAPLPKGEVRVYATHNEQSLLLGENTIANTAKNRQLTINVGKAFDLTLTQSLLNRNNTKNFYSVDVLYRLKNSSQSTKTIQLYVPYNRKSDSQVVSEIPHTFTKANLVTFSIALKANTQEEFKVHYESRKNG